MTMTTKRPLRSTAVVWAVALLVAVTSLAVGAPAAVAATPGWTNCATVIEKLRPDAPATRVVSRSCTVSTRAATLDPKPIVTAAAVYTPLLIQYEHLNYGGRSNVLYGTSGPCDQYGYSINRNQWGTLTSSIKWAS